jgi:hypothetical protein
MATFLQTFRQGTVLNTPSCPAGPVVVIIILYPFYHTSTSTADIRFLVGLSHVIYLSTTLKLGIENPNPTVPGAFLCKKIFDIATFILLNFYFPKPVCKGRYTCVSYISKSKKGKRLLGT